MQGKMYIKRSLMYNAPFFSAFTFLLAPQIKKNLVSAHLAFKFLISDGILIINLFRPTQCRLVTCEKGSKSTTLTGQCDENSKK